MRGIKAKKLRKAIFGDMSYKGKRYVKNVDNGMIRVTGLHAEYKKAKKIGMGG